MDTHARYRTPTTPLGVRLYPAPSAASRLAAVGLHHSDPRYAFACEAVRAAPPERRAAVAERFRVAPPAPVPLPPYKPPAWLSAGLAAKNRATLVGIGESLRDCPMWAARAEIFRIFLVGRQDASATRETHAATLAMLAAMLGTVPMQSVAALEQAAYLAIMPCVAWRAAAREWLQPVCTTWLVDWTATQPEYLALATFAQTYVENDAP
jgi:hypothetical protein